MPNVKDPTKIDWHELTIPRDPASLIRTGEWGVIAYLTWLENTAFEIRDRGGKVQIRHSDGKVSLWRLT